MSHVLKIFVTVPIKQGTNEEEFEKPMHISWDNVPLNSNKVGPLENLCMEWHENAA